MSATTTLQDLVTDVTLYGRFKADEEGFTNELDIETLVVASARKHNSSYKVSSSETTVPTVEHTALVYLCCAELCLIRAAKFAQENSVTTSSSVSGFGIDRDTPFQKNMALSKEYMTRYTNTCKALNLSDYAGAPQFGDVVVESINTGAPNRPELSYSPPPITLEARSTQVQPDGTLVIAWTQAKVPSFDFYEIYHMEGSDPVYQEWNNVNTVNAARVNNDATKVSVVRKQDIRAVKLSGLDDTTGVTNRVLVVCHNEAGKAAYSNELVITQQ